MTTTYVANVSIAGGYWRIHHYIGSELRSFVTNVETLRKPTKGSLITFKPHWRQPDRVTIGGVVVYERSEPRTVQSA